VNAYIDQHRNVHGVEPICRQLQVAPSAYRRHAARLRDPSKRSQRVQRDEQLMTDIDRVWQESLGVYGADKVWRQLNREGIAVARYTVERLMRSQGLRGVRRGKRVRTTVADDAGDRPLDRVKRLQEQVANHHERRRSKACVVSVMEKVPERHQVWINEGEQQ